MINEFPDPPIDTDAYRRGMRTHCHMPNYFGGPGIHMRWCWTIAYNFRCGPDEPWPIALDNAILQLRWFNDQEARISSN